MVKTHKQKLENWIEMNLDLAWNSSDADVRETCAVMVETYATQYHDLTGRYYTRRCNYD